MEAVKENFNLNLPDNLTNLCIKDLSMKNMYKRALKEKNLPVKLIDIWSVMELKKDFMHHSAYQARSHLPHQYQEDAKKSGESFHEIVDGVAVLPDTIVETFKREKNKVQILYNSTVNEINISDEVNVFYKRNTDDHEVRKFDKVVLTPTSAALSMVRFSPNLPYNKTYALSSFSYMNSVKVFLAFSDAFWATENKIPKINFNSTTEKNGGSVVTDLPCRVIYYPSHPYHGFSLLASYVWGKDADRLTAFTDEDLILLVLDNLVEIHGEVARDHFKEGKVMKWVEEGWTMGAFPWVEVGQTSEFLPSLREHFMDKAFFAGEYTSKVIFIELLKLKPLYPSLVMDGSKQL